MKLENIVPASVDMTLIIKKYSIWDEFFQHFFPFIQRFLSLFKIYFFKVLNINFRKLYRNSFWLNKINKTLNCFKGVLCEFCISLL